MDTTLISMVDGDHPVVVGRGVTRNGKVRPPKSLHPKVRTWWVDHGLGQADFAAIATSRNLLVGFFRYSWVTCSGPMRHLADRGTWVSPRYRKRGIAGSLWKFVIEKEGATDVSVTSISRAGAKMVKSVARSVGARIDHTEL